MKSKIVLRNLSEKDNLICKEFELIERGLANTLGTDNPNLRATMSGAWHERTCILLDEAASADSVYLREGISKRLIEIREDLETIKTTCSMDGKKSLWERLADKFGKSDKKPSAGPK